jgi:ABC-type multidrug transport system fused ATPase/permease subunit
MSRLVLAGRVMVARAAIVPLIGLGVLGCIMLGRNGWRPGAAYWLTALAFLLVVHPVSARATRLGAAVAGAAALGFLGWTDPALTAVIAVPLVAGALANRQAAAARIAGMSAVGAALDRVSDGTAQLICAGRSERVRRNHLATVDRFHDVFSAQTRRVSTAVVWAEIAFSPVTILAVILAAGAVLMTPGADVLAFLLLGPLIGGCVATLTRQQPTGVPSQFTTDTQANIRRTIGRLRSAVTPGSDVRKAAIAAVVTALLHGVSFALAITVVWSLLDHRWPWLPLFSLLAVAIAHTLALYWSSGSAQVAGVAVLRQLSHCIIDRILMAPEGSLAKYKDQLPHLATRDAVTTSGLPVHALRPFVSVGLTPVTAMLMMIIIDWRLATLALLLLPLVALVIRLLLKEPRRDLQSALAATNRVLDFSQGESLPGVGK